MIPPETPSKRPLYRAATGLRDPASPGSPRLDLRAAVHPTAGALIALMVLGGLVPGVLRAAGPAAGRATIWEFAEELELTGSQVDQLKRTAFELQVTLQKLQEEREEEDRRAGRLIIGRAPLEAVRLQLERIARLDVRMRLEDVKAARAMEDLLEDRQRDRWDRIREAARQAPPRR